MGVHQIPFKNTRSVTFNCVDFCSQVKRGSRLRHTIYSRSNEGISATPTGFGVGMGISPLRFSFGTARDFDFEHLLFGDSIKQGFCTPSGVMHVWMKSEVQMVTLSSAWSVAGNEDINLINHTEFAASNHQAFTGGVNGVWHGGKQLLDINADAMLVSFGRLFVASGEKIHFSAALEPADFQSETSGQLNVDSNLGKILNLRQLDNSQVLIVQEYGFAILQITHAIGGFALSTLARSFQPVVKNTAQVFGDEVYYLTHGGVCRILRNGNVELLDIPVNYTHREYSSAVFENRYYLTLADRILVIERFFQSFSFIGDVRAKQMFPVRSVNGENRLAILTDDSVSRVHAISSDGHFSSSNQNGFSQSSRKLPQSWESEPFGLSYGAGRQWLKQFHIKTNCNLTVTLTATSSGRTQVIEISPHDELQRFNVNLRGDMFTIHMETEDEDINVSDLSVVVAFGR